MSHTTALIAFVVTAAPATVVSAWMVAFWIEGRRIRRLNEAAQACYEFERAEAKRLGTPPPPPPLLWRRG